MTKNDFNGAAGELSVGFAIGNRGSVTCTIFGYPALVLTGGGAPIPVTSHSAQGPAFRASPEPVTIAPGGSAGFVYEFSDVQSNGGQCFAASSIEVTLPATGALATTVPYKAYPCGSAGAVSAIVTSVQESAQFR